MKFTSNIGYESLKNELEKLQIKFALSIGRRQPMHIAHLDCLREISMYRLHPIIIIGSANQPTNKFFDPFKNPLTIKQQKIQLEVALQKIKVEKFTIFEIEDNESSEIWLNSIIESLKKIGIKPDETVMHYRTKNENIDNKTLIKPLSSYEKLFQTNSIAVWESYNKSKLYDKLNSTYFRTFNIESAAFLDEKSNLVAPEYISEQIFQARSANPDKNKLYNLPLTMLDLSLIRLLREKNIKTSSLLGKQAVNTVHDLKNILKDFVANLF